MLLKTKHVRTISVQLALGLFLKFCLNFAYFFLFIQRIFGKSPRRTKFKNRVRRDKLAKDIYVHNFFQ